MAQVLSKNHELTPAQIDEILERTAVKLTEHKSNDFGSGLLDAYAAVQAVDYDGITETTQKVSVYPNPSSSDFTVVCEGMSQLQVFSIDGRLVKLFSVSGSSCQIDGLERGIYLVRVKTGKGCVIKKIVKV